MTEGTSIPVHAVEIRPDEPYTPEEWDALRAAATMARWGRLPAARGCAIRGRAIVRTVEPIPTETRSLRVAGARREVRVPIGNRLYGATSNPGRRPGWVLVDIHRLVVVDPVTIYSTPEAAIQEAWEREQSD